MIDVIGLQRKTEQYEFADGIRDLQTALWLIVIGFYAWLVFDMQSSLLRPLVELAKTQGAVFALLIFFILGIGIPVIVIQGAMELVNRYVRPRWLWRNTGMITAKRWIVPRGTLFAAFVVMIAVFIGGTFVAMWLNDFWIIFRGIFAGTGLELALMYVLLGRRFNMPRYPITALAGTVGTMVIVVLPVTVGTVGLLVSLLWAILLTITGVYGMRQVLIQQKAAADAA